MGSIGICGRIFSRLVMGGVAVWLFWSWIVYRFGL